MLIVICIFQLKMYGTGNLQDTTVRISFTLKENSALHFW